MQTFKRIIGLLLAALITWGWFSYVPFLMGYWGGLYPLAVVYSRLLSLVAGLMVLAVLSLWPWMIGAIILCGFCWRLTRRHGFRWALGAALCLPLMTLVLLPAAVMTCVPGPSVQVAPWAETYRTVYSAFALDDTYGKGLVLRCNFSGILCSKVHQFATNVGAIDRVVLTYEPTLDHLIVTDEANNVMYRRSRQTTLCENTQSYRPNPASALCYRFP